jgi:hypothetical protein
LNEVKDTTVSDIPLGQKMYKSLTPKSLTEDIPTLDRQDAEMLEKYNSELLEAEKLKYPNQEKNYNGLMNLINENKPQDNTIQQKEEIKVLFTTEDNIDIFDDDNYYYWSVEDDWVVKIHVSGMDIFMPEYKHFSTEAAAIGYVRAHRPLLSLTDCAIGIPQEHFRILSNIVNEKLAKTKINL